MILETAAAGPFLKNGYVLGCERTREAVYIDPGDEAEELLAFIAAEQLIVNHLLLTHAHVDHVSGVARAKRETGAPIYLQREDLFLYEDAVQHGMLFGIRIEEPPPVDRFYDGSVITFGDYQVTVYQTPGHCPGGVCLAVSPRTLAPSHPGTPHLFVGDTLFAGSIGRTDLPGGDYETLMQSITQVLFAFGDDAPVYSGHGPQTTIGRERETNPFILEYLSRKHGSTESRKA
jgi:glyoxylase-like metal-dependent hydrolase (beta-lactamase superfamily II)